MSVITPDPALAGVASGETRVAMYRTAALIKVCDERFRAMLAAGQFYTTYYSPRGQELIPAAFAQVLTAEDYLVTTYRGIHDQIAKGVPLDQLLAECLGRSTGTCGGKGGPMHITHPASGLMVTTGIVGAGLPIANGLALSAQLKGESRVTVVNFGDGATNIGAFHEALNLAGLWKLPVVFVCQNNQYAEHTALADGTSVERISDRGASYRVPAVEVDGNDASAIHAAASAAVARARAGEGPTLIDAHTFRFYGHIPMDDNAYMKPGELEAARAADPVVRLREQLLADGSATEEQLAAIDADALARVEAAWAFALASPPADPSTLLTDVYQENR